MTGARARSLRTVLAFAPLAIVAACTSLQSGSVTDGEDASAEGGAGDGGGEVDAAPADARADARESGPPAHVCPVAPDAPKAISFVLTFETAFDSVTGLMWERTNRTAELAKQSDAKALCENLSLAGHTDWRLPTRSEAYSIADLSRDFPKIDSAIFPGVGPNFLWTSSFSGTGPDDVWLVDFSSGTTLRRSDHAQGDAGLAYDPRVRCVRDETPRCSASPRFVALGEVVRDDVTGLEWQTTAAAPRLGPDAVAHCNSLPAVAGRPWRVPGAKESDSFVVDSAAGTYVDPVFPAAAWTRFWTGTRSSTVGLSGTYVLDLEIASILESASDSTPSAVRCVR